MFKNYLKSSFRSLKKQKGFTIINILGLSIGMACCLFIYLFVQDELSYDKFNEKANRIYRVNYQAMNENIYARIPPPVAPLMQGYFPEVEKTARLFERNISLKFQDTSGDWKNFEEERLFFTDSSFFDIFTLEFVAGDVKTKLEKPFQIVINEEIAEKYFGPGWRENNAAIGKSLFLEGEQPYEIVAVVKDFPSNSHLHFNLLIPYDNMFDMGDPEVAKIAEANLTKNWVISHSHTYALLKEGASHEPVNQRFPAFLDNYAPAELKVDQKFYLQPLLETHLDNSIEITAEPTGSWLFIYIFSGIAFITLLIACFNFINLATAQSLRRTQEVSMRKVLGAQKKQLFIQFLGESLMITFIAFLIALFIVDISLPGFNSLTQKTLSFASLINWEIIAGFFGIFLITGLLGGSYPAFYVTRINILLALKGKTSDDGRQRLSFRQTLVVFQFTISIALIAASLTMFSQLQYMRNIPLGFHHQNMVTIPVFSENFNNIFGGVNGELRSRLNAFEQSILENPKVEAATLSSQLPGLGAVYRNIEPEGVETEGKLFGPIMAVDYDFVDTYGLSVIAGRDFSIEAGTDHLSSFIINEKAVDQFNWESPEKALGKEIILEGKKGNIIGVIKDFNFLSLRLPIDILILEVNVPVFNTFSIKTSGQDLPETLEFLEEKWNSFFPEKTFQYSFLDESLADQYQNDRRLGRIIGIFAILAVIVSCLGTYGLSMIHAKRKEKEIGIRKVLGASVSSILLLLTQNYMKLIIISSFIAIPATIWLMLRWLDNFAYKTPLNAWLLVSAVGMVLIIAIFSISYQTIKSAIINPVESLKQE